MKKEKADLFVTNATIYTVDNEFTVVNSMALRDGKILACGTEEKIKAAYRSKEILSLEGKYIYPGWNDAHCHFVGYGLSLNLVELAGTASVEEIIERCKKFAENNPGSWITGRGWDQNDWEIKDFPTKEMLDEVFPDTPVLLRRIDGHAAWVNSKAIEIAGLNNEIKIEGGDVLLKDGEVTGILIDNAIDLADKFIPEPDQSAYIAGILKAQENCFAVGLTSVSDAGLSTTEVKLLDSLHSAGHLKMRINAWLSPGESNFSTYISKGVSQNDYLRIGTLKLYADGALGSRGARMIDDYADDPGNKGLFVSEIPELKKKCQRALDGGFQVAIHCIGDDANHQVLKMYADLLGEGNKNRWRIEHAQIIHPDDIPLFGKYSIIPSVQPTHATSDMYWAEERIGPERMSGAYSFKSLLEQLDWIPFGSDFPVESINPLYGFYAAVSRKDHSGYPEDGFLPEEAVTREQALRAMTIWAAKASFEEDLKGSLEAGKLADFVVTDKDIMKMDLSAIPELKVEETWSGGERVYKRK